MYTRRVWQGKLLGITPLWYSAGQDLLTCKLISLEMCDRPQSLCRAMFLHMQSSSGCWTVSLLLAGYKRWSNSRRNQPKWVRTYEQDSWHIQSSWLQIFSYTRCVKTFLVPLCIADPGSMQSARCLPNIVAIVKVFLGIVAYTCINCLSCNYQKWRTNESTCHRSCKWLSSHADP